MSSPIPQGLSSAHVGSTPSQTDLLGSSTGIAHFPQIKVPEWASLARMGLPRALHPCLPPTVAMGTMDSLDQVGLWRTLNSCLPHNYGRGYSVLSDLGLVNFWTRKEIATFNQKDQNWRKIWCLNKKLRHVFQKVLYVGKKKSVSVTFSYIPLMPTLQSLSSTLFDESQFWRMPGTYLVQDIQLNQIVTVVGFLGGSRKTKRKKNWHRSKTCSLQNYGKQLVMNLVIEEINILCNILLMV